MKKLLIVFMLLCTFGAKAQSKWNIVGGIGAGVYKSDRFGSAYLDDNKIYFDINAGVRHNLSNMLYLQTGLSYTYFTLNIDKVKYSVESGLPLPDIDFNNQMYLSIPLLVGFNYKKENRIYPFIQVGGIVNYAIQKYLIEASVVNLSEEKRINLGLLAKIGIGVNISQNITLEPAFVFQRTTKIDNSDGSYNQLLGGQISLVYKL